MIGAAWILLKRLKERQAADKAYGEWTCYRCGVIRLGPDTDRCEVANAFCEPSKHNIQAPKDDSKN